MSMIHVGSKAVRQLIEKDQPLIGLHGHIHEARGFVKIGRTLCINPGSEYGEGVLRGASKHRREGLEEPPPDPGIKPKQAETRTSMF